MQRHINNFVSQELFRGEKLPPKTRRRYWLRVEDLRNYMYSTKVAQRYSKLDQENLAGLVQNWKAENPDDSFYLRLFKKSEEDKETVKEMVKQMVLLEGRFLFCHQTKFQKRLLGRYGNDLILLDATYRTTRYAKPLFILCVRTNVKYIPVGEFVCQCEDTESVKEALEIFKSWNNSWSPKYAMVDFSEEEITALEDVFPGKSYILQFSMFDLGKYSSDHIKLCSKF